MKRILRHSRSPSRRHQSADELIQGIRKREEEYLELVQQKNGVYSLQRKAMEVIEKNEKEKAEKKQAARGRTEEVVKGQSRGRSLTKMVRSITRSLSRGRSITGSQSQQRLDTEESASRATAESRTTLSSSKSDLEKSDITDVQAALKEMENELRVAKRFGRTVSRAQVMSKLLNVVDTLGVKEEEGADNLHPITTPNKPPNAPETSVLRASSYGLNAYTSPDRYRKITKEDESYDSESSGSGTGTSYAGTCDDRTYYTNDDTGTMFTNDDTMTMFTNDDTVTMFTNDYTNDTNDYTNNTNDYTNDFISDDVMNYDASTIAGETTIASEKTRDRGTDSYGFGKFSMWGPSHTEDDEEETDEDDDDDDDDEEETVSTQETLPKEQRTYTQSLIAASRTLGGNLSPKGFMKDNIRSHSRPITPVDYSRPLSPIVSKNVVSSSVGSDSAPTSPATTAAGCNTVGLGIGKWLDMNNKDLEKVLDDFLFRSPVSCPVPTNTCDTRDSPPPSPPIPLTRSMEHKSPLSNEPTEYSTSQFSGEDNERNHTFEKARSWLRRNKKEPDSSQPPLTRITICDPCCTPQRVDSPVSYDDRAERAFGRYKVQQKAAQQQQQPPSTTPTWNAATWPIPKRN